MLDLGLYLVYTLFAVAVITAIVFPILNAIKTPGAMKTTLMAVGFLLVLFGISYALSGSSISDKNMALGVTATKSKLIGAGLIMFYLTLTLAVVALIYSEVTKALK